MFAMNNYPKIIGVALPNKWSGQNWTHLTSDYGPALITKDFVYTVIQDIFISKNFHAIFFVQKIFIQDSAYENILKGHFPIVNNF